jgi:serine/threonine protein kinase
MKEKTEDFNNYYEIENEIGRGPRFGIISNAIKKKTKEKKAIKIIEKKRIIDYLRSRGIAEPKETDIDFYFKGFLREAHNMEILLGKKKENMNAVFIDEFYNTKNEFAIVMEKCDNNLFNHLADRNEPFNSGEIYEILKQLNNSFKIMVEKKILHRAIKLQNILLKYLNDEKTKFIVKLKITDDSCSLNDASNLLSSVIENNNLSISSPEILKEEKEIEKCDLWSIGILIYTLYFRIFPFEGNDENELLENIKSTIEKGNLRNINDDKLNDLVKNLLKINPKDRISWDKYFNHPFFIENPKNNYENFYTKKEIIGVGKFGYVYKGIKNDTKEERAIKIISKINYNTYVSNLEETSYTTFIKSLENEIDNMTIAQGINRDNQNSIKLYEYFNMKDEFVIIMELCDCNLADILKEKEKKNEQFNFNEIREILTQLNNTFKILVNKKVIHRDLKLQNILLKKNNGQNIWKLADYGVSKQLITFNDQTYTSGIGTPLYMAPEVCEGLKCCHKCDLWSLGIIIYKLYFKEEPYKGYTIVAILNQIKKIGKKALTESGNKCFDDLIQKLLEENPKKRISWEDYFDHDFFK